MDPITLMIFAGLAGLFAVVASSRPTEEEEDPPPAGGGDKPLPDVPNRNDMPVPVTPEPLEQVNIVDATVPALEAILPPEAEIALVPTTEGMVGIHEVNARFRYRLVSYAVVWPALPDRPQGYTAALWEWSMPGFAHRRGVFVRSGGDIGPDESGLARSLSFVLDDLKFQAERMGG